MYYVITTEKTNRAKLSAGKLHEVFVDVLSKHRSYHRACEKSRKWEDVAATQGKITEICTLEKDASGGEYYVPAH